MVRVHQYHDWLAHSKQRLSPDSADETDTHIFSISSYATLSRPRHQTDDGGGGDGLRQLNGVILPIIYLSTIFLSLVSVIAVGIMKFFLVLARLQGLSKGGLRGVKGG